MIRMGKAFLPLLAAGLAIAVQPARLRAQDSVAANSDTSAVLADSARAAVPGPPPGSQDTTFVVDRGGGGVGKRAGPAAPGDEENFFRPAPGPKLPTGPEGTGG